MNTNKICVGKNHWVLIDETDYELVSRFRLFLSKKGSRLYARCVVIIGKLNGKHVYRTVSLHKLIMRPPNGMQVDHRNHNGLDCRRSNMRICTNGQNKQNCRSAKNSSSRYKGVCWNKALQKWHSAIEIILNNKRKCIHLGYYKEEQKAARAYDGAAIKYFGEFACLNFTAANKVA